MGQIQTFIDALVSIERTVDPKLRVYPFRPEKIEAPAIYNWLLPSESDIPATMQVVDSFNFAVRVVVSTSDIDEEETAAIGYFDLVRAALDRDMIEPHKSVLRNAAHETKRTTSRTLDDWFDQIPYLAVEFVIRAEFRSFFQPT